MPDNLAQDSLDAPTFYPEPDTAAETEIDVFHALSSVLANAQDGLELRLALSVYLGKLDRRLRALEGQARGRGHGLA